MLVIATMTMTTAMMMMMMRMMMMMMMMMMMIDDDDLSWQYATTFRKLGFLTESFSLLYWRY
uniref:Uncharacterized protein n=1 Tax=Octopus bimaculoides TaxID=37653 RepID=A0A0L8G8M3_OCTBM